MFLNRVSKKNECNFVRNEVELLKEIVKFQLSKRKFKEVGDFLNNNLQLTKLKNSLVD